VKTRRELGLNTQAVACATPTQATTLVLEARREKVKAITLVRQFQDDLFVSGLRDVDDQKLENNNRRSPRATT